MRLLPVRAGRFVVDFDLRGSGFALAIAAQDPQTLGECDGLAHEIVARLDPGQNDYSFHRA